MLIWLAEGHPTPARSDVFNVLVQTYTQCGKLTSNILRFF